MLFRKKQDADLGDCDDFRCILLRPRVDKDFTYDEEMTEKMNSIIRSEIQKRLRKNNGCETSTEDEEDFKLDKETSERMWNNILHEIRLRKAERK